MDDAALATHAKASALFLDGWSGVNAIVMGGSGDAAAEAAAYEAQLAALSEDVLPRDAEGRPVFDCALIGVGDDGHVGSLYPGRGEVLDCTRDGSPRGGAPGARAAEGEGWGACAHREAGRRPTPPARDA